MTAKGKMRVIHSFTDDSAVIRLEGLTKPVRMLHLTDTHLRFYDERDGENFQACVDYCQRIEKLNRERGIEPDPEKALRQAMAQAATEDLDLLALTRGSEGAELYVPGKEYRTQSPRVAVVDTVGAGDAFSAALAAGLMQGADPGQILEVACEAATFTVQQRGPQVELPENLRRAFMGWPITQRSGNR